MIYMGVKLGLSFQERNRLRIMEKKLLRRLFGPKGEEVPENWGKLNNVAPIICNLHTILLG
jgi:hypothetical protein